MSEWVGGWTVESERSVIKIYHAKRRTKHLFLLSFRSFFWVVHLQTAGDVGKQQQRAAEQF